MAVAHLDMRSYKAALARHMELVVSDRVRRQHRSQQARPSPPPLLVSYRRTRSRGGPPGPWHAPARPPLPRWAAGYSYRVAPMCGLCEPVFPQMQRARRRPLPEVQYAPPRRVAARGYLGAVLALHRWVRQLLTAVDSAINIVAPAPWVRRRTP